MSFLPVTKQEMEQRGWTQADFVLVSGDAYVDHPTFGAAIISRVLENKGYRVAMLPQPDFHSPADFARFGRPKLGFLVTSGNVDSMVAHYTVALNKRKEDAYSPGGKPGKRPDRACAVYTGLIRQAWGNIPVVLGGLEASLRRFAHYDYWSDSVRPSILEESGADLLIFGMGERPVEEVAARLAAGWLPGDKLDVRGTCVMGAGPVEGYVELESFEQVARDKASYARACRAEHEEQDSVRGKGLLQRHGNRWLIQNSPAVPLDRTSLDRVYGLPYTRRVHPMYDSQGGVPAIAEVEFSITHNRGCFGDCNFCSIAFHQGRAITSRSVSSVVKEAEELTGMENFKGYIHDVGGPTANFRFPSCEKQKELGLCKNRKCLAPAPCPSLKVGHGEYLEMLRKVRGVKGVKKVFIRSGIRFDYLMADKDDSFFKELVREHVSGQLKVAPEHSCPFVLACMGKPSVSTYLRFSKRFFELTKSMGKKQYLVPYLMSSHPGSRLEDAVELALFIKQQGLHPEQVQDFYPTPGTISTCMFYTGINPLTGEKVYVPRDSHEKAMQRALMQFDLPQNRRLVKEALEKTGRRDLIGFGPGCLIKPDRGEHPAQPEVSKQQKGRSNRWVPKGEPKSRGRSSR